MKNKGISSYEKFYKELERNLEYLTDGGTNYRIKSAEYALAVAQKYRQIEPFLEKDNVKIIVQKYFPSMDEERLTDVSKMLYVIAREIFIKENQTPEFKTMVKKKAKLDMERYRLKRMENKDL